MSFQLHAICYSRGGEGEDSPEPPIYAQDRPTTLILSELMRLGEGIHMHVLLVQAGNYKASVGMNHCACCCWVDVSKTNQHVL